MEDNCIIHLERYGGKIRVTTFDENNLLFEPSSLDREKMFAVLPLLRMDVQYPLKLRASHKHDDHKLIISMEDSGAVYDVVVNKTIQSILISWRE